MKATGIHDREQLCAPAGVQSSMVRSAALIVRSLWSIHWKEILAYPTGSIKQMNMC
jgi:hypothetical protein